MGALVKGAEVAQLVEQRTENPRVAGSIPAFGTAQAGVVQLVERLLAKEKVVGSSPIARSEHQRQRAEGRWLTHSRLPSA